MRDEIDTERCRELANKEPTTYDPETFAELEDVMLEVEIVVEGMKQANKSLHKTTREGERLLSRREHNTVNSAKRDVQEILQSYNDLLEDMKETYRKADNHLYGNDE